MKLEAEYQTFLRKLEEARNASGDPSIDTIRNLVAALLGDIDLQAPSVELEPIHAFVRVSLLHDIPLNWLLDIPQGTSWENRLVLENFPPTISPEFIEYIKAGFLEIFRYEAQRVNLDLSKIQKITLTIQNSDGRIVNCSAVVVMKNAQKHHLEFLLVSS